jgi:hypothetical protein
MLATSLSSLLLLLAHLSGSSAKHISFGSNHDNLLLHRALRRSVDGSPSGTAAALAAPSSAGTPSTPSQASDVQTNYDWDGVIDLSSPPPANLTESAADQEKDTTWCSDTKCYYWGSAIVVLVFGVPLTVWAVRKYFHAARLYSRLIGAPRRYYANKAIVDKYFTTGWSASPDEFNALPAELQTRWLRNAPADIRNDYRQFEAEGFLAQHPRQRDASMQSWIESETARPCVLIQPRKVLLTPGLGAPPSLGN